MKIETKSATVTALAPIDVVQNFSVLYRLSAALERDALSTADSAALSQLSVQTYAPSPGVCVDIYDDRTSATADAIAGGGSDPWTWSWTLSVPLETLEGRYGLDVWARDCSSGTALSARPRVSYVIDNTAPEIDSLSVTPRAGSNTVFTSQPIQVKASDALAGLDVTGSGATLEPTAGGAAIDVAGQVWYEDSTWLVTDAAPLTVGERYRLRLRVVDLAGNAALYEYGFDDDEAAFLAMSMTPTSAQATMSQTCSLGPIDPLSQTREAHCPSPTLNVGDSVVDLSGSLHADVAFVDHVVPLDRAELQGTLVGGVSDPNPQPAYPQGTTRTVSMRFAVEDPLPAAATLGVPAATFAQEAVVTAVPATWISAQLTLDAATSPEVVGCSVRESVPMPRDCSPDPLHHRYLVTFDDSITDVETAVADHAGRFRTEAKIMYDSPFKGYLAWVPPQSLDGLVTAEGVQKVIRDAFEIHQVHALSWRFDTTLTDDGGAADDAISKFRTIYDVYGGSHTSQESGGVELQVASSGSDPATCTNSTPPAGSKYAAVSRTAAAVNFADEFNAQWLFALHRLEEAWHYVSVGTVRHLAMCATGGGDAENGWRTHISGAGMAYKGWKGSPNEGAGPMVHPALYDFDFGAAEEKTPNDEVVEVTMGVDLGVITIQGRLVQGPRANLYGSHNAPPAQWAGDGELGAYWMTAANRWWRDLGCAWWLDDLTGCQWLKGSSDYQGAPSAVVWELEQHKTPVHLARTMYYSYRCASLSCIGDLIFGRD